MPADAWRIADVKSRLGESLVRQQRFRDAETLLLEGYAVLEVQSDMERANVRARRALQRVVVLYDAWDKPEKAAEWRAKLPTEQEAAASDKPAQSSSDEKQDE